MSRVTSQSIGYISCERQLAEDLFLGRIEFPEGQVRRCIIQFLSDGRGELGRRRFTREAMLGLDVSRDHENLVSVMHFGVWEDGRLFIVLDCIEGRAVSEMFPELTGHFPAITMLAHTLLRALDFLHRKGVVHGGVVAGNILIGRDGVIRLGGFARARRFATGDTEAGPHQQQDLMALGCLIFELVTGKSVAELEDQLDRDDDVAVLEEHLPQDTPDELLTMLAHLFRGEDPIRPASVSPASVSPASVSPDGEKREDSVAPDVAGSDGETGTGDGGVIWAAERFGLAGDENVGDKGSEIQPRRDNAGMAHISEDELDNFASNLVVLFSTMLAEKQEAWRNMLHEALASHMPPAPQPPAPQPPVPQPPVQDTKTPDPPRAAHALRGMALWVTAAVAVAVLALVVAVYTSTRPYEPDRGKDVESWSDPILEEPLPDDSMESSPSEPIPPGPAGEDPSPGVASEVPRDSTAREPVPAGSRVAVGEQGRERTGSIVKQNVAVRDNVPLATVLAEQEHEDRIVEDRVVVFDRHASNDRGVLLSATQARLQGNGVLIIDVTLYNAGQKTFDATQFLARPTNDPTFPLVDLPVVVQKASRCSKYGPIVPQARCRVSLWIEEPTLLRSRNVTLVVSESQGGNTIELTGLVW